MADLCPICALDDRLEEHELEQALWVVCTGHDPPFKVRQVDQMPRRPAGMPDLKAPTRVTQKAWERYDRWNAAIARALFDGQFAGRPVYMDLEEELLRKVAAEAGDDTSDPASALIEAVRETLNVPPSSGRLFSAQWQRLQSWETRGRPEYPPVLAVLALQSLVAERMIGDGDLRENNYYGRLCEILGIDAHDSHVRDKVVRDFMLHAHGLWEALNRWLLAARGARGLPTAYAFDRRVHVGLPMSQALVRAGDRHRLPELFEASHLSPGQDLSVTDMVRLLEEWIVRAPVSASLQRLWATGGAKHRIAEVVSVELASWDGREQDAAARTSDVRRAQIRVVASVRTFPRPRLDLGLAVRACNPPPGPFRVPHDAGAHVRACFEECQSIALVPHLSQEWLRFECESVSVPDLLLGPVRLESDEGVLTRPGRRLVVLQHDLSRGWFAEVGQAQLGADLLLLTRDNLADEVDAVLSRAARPGFERCDKGSLDGQPDGWVVFRSVQLSAVPETENADLSGLVPVGWTQVAFGDGLMLSGVPRTWHAEQPPELRVSALDEDEAELEVRRLRLAGDDDEAAVDHRVRFAGSTAVDLGRMGAGDYEVRITQARSGRGRVLARSGFQLRSADHVSPALWLGRSILARDVAGDRGWSMVSATTSTAISDGLVNGPRAEAIPLFELPMRPCSRLPQGLPPASRPLGPEDGLGPPALSSPRSTSAAECLITGAHYWELPVAYSDRPTGSKIHGICRYCGSRRWWPARPPPRRLSWESSPTRTQADRQPASVPPIAGRRPSDVGTLFDAVCYVGQGSWSIFEGLCRSVEDTPWFPLEYARSLSALGHLEVELDQRTLRPIRWQVTVPRVVVGDDGEAYLAGFRSQALLAAVQEAAAAQGGGLVQEAMTSTAPGTCRVVGLERAADLVEAVAARTSWRLEVVRNPAETLALAVCDLKTVLSRMAWTGVPSQAPVERYEPRGRAWVRCGRVERPGGYRFQKRPLLYAIATEEDSPADGVRVVDSRLVKHVAAAMEGQALVAYDGSRLIVPLGAQLPGLYERAAVLCSGLAPVSRVDGTVTYGGVTPAVAERLHQALSWA